MGLGIITVSFSEPIVNDASGQSVRRCSFAPFLFTLMILELLI